MSQVLACRNKPRFKLAGMKRLRKKMLGLSEPGTEVALITSNAGKNWSLVILAAAAPHAAPAASRRWVHCSWC